MANDSHEPDYPPEWGYNKPPAGALEAAFDVYAASLSDDEFTALVGRTRAGDR